tara:strand:- start:2793 stop:3158 length:366 start_codon:yes stop_codon:yes gene_type:complete
MTIFGFTCAGCGKHESGDFTQHVIAKVNNKYMRGKYNPYKTIPHPLLLGSKLYVPEIKLDSGEVAYPNEFKKYFYCWGVRDGVDLVATELYCNGLIDGGVDERLLSCHRRCYPKQVNISRA